MLTKQEEFLWMVQTAILSNAVNLATCEDLREEYREVYSSTGVRIMTRDAVRASKRIPKGMEAADAVDEWCIWQFRNHREVLLRDDPEASTPSWFAQ